jgi:RNA polymerase II elongation factor ELL
MFSGTALLDGAPDALIGTAEAKGNSVQVMQLEMSNDVLEELLESARRGKQPQIVFGRTPVCLGPFPWVSFAKCREPTSLTEP